jgi:hypothetical protein
LIGGRQLICLILANESDAMGMDDAQRLWGVTMGSAYPRNAIEPNNTAPEPDPPHLEAVEQENKELKDLVVQLSKLVIKYVMEKR